MKFSNKYPCIKKEDCFDPILIADTELFVDPFSVFEEKGGVVLGATFELTQDDPSAIAARMADLAARRKEKQPLEWPSAGSTFKRPQGAFAAALIDQCGLKGLTVGGAQVSEKHAGFVINIGGATCEDVTELIRQVQERVLAEKGVQLEPEVRIIKA
jgi:UDP-N-acetylmuramate dehydrogenase